MRNLLPALLLCLPTAQPQEASPPSPRERFRALQDDYEASREGSRESYAGRFLRLAEDHPGDPAAFDALDMVVTGRFTLDDEVRALELLTRDHARNVRFAPFCIRLRWLSRTPAWPQAEAWLRRVVEVSPSPQVRAQACFSLAEFLEDKAQFVRYFGRNPDEAGQPLFRAMLGEGGVQALRGCDPDELEAEAERLYTRVVERYADIEGPSGSLAEQAEGRRFAIRNLGLGKVAPDLVGQDLEGRPMRLSEHRGKVVVLTFWASWCGPCMALIPEERSLVERLKGRPFAMVGVNCDADVGAAKRAEVSWRSFRDGDPEEGPIVRRWGVHSWPTTLVLDPQGVIRFKNVSFPNKERFQDAVDVLLTEMAAGH